MKKWIPVLPCLFFAAVIQCQTVVLTPQKDNTIFSENSNASSGAGAFLYIGRTGTNANNSLRRALLQFDLGTIPANAIINSVSLSIVCTKVPPSSTSPNTVGLYAATQSWGEGSSVGGGGAGTQATNGDATWACRFSNGLGACSLAWSANGGDFIGSPSAAVEVDEAGTYTITSNTALIADIQRWLDSPSMNFGWILIGDEGTSYSVREFASKEHASAGSKLTVMYSVPACTSNTWTGAVSDAWEIAGNWSCNVVPDSSMQVVINAGTVALNSNVTVKTLQLNSGASLTVKPGVLLTVLQ